MPEIISEVINKLLSTVQMYKATNLYCNTFSRVWGHEELHVPDKFNDAEVVFYLDALSSLNAERGEPSGGAFVYAGPDGGVLVSANTARNHCPTDPMRTHSTYVIPIKSYDGRSRMLSDMTHCVSHCMHAAHCWRHNHRSVPPLRRVW